MHTAVIYRPDPQLYIPKEMSQFKIRPSTFDSMCRILGQMLTGSRMWTLQKWLTVFVDDDENLNFITPADDINTIIHGNQRAFTTQFPCIMFLGHQTGQLLRIHWDPQNNKY